MTIFCSLFFICNGKNFDRNFTNIQKYTEVIILKLKTDAINIQKVEDIYGECFL